MVSGNEIWGFLGKLGAFVITVMALLLGAGVTIGLGVGTGLAYLFGY